MSKKVALIKTNEEKFYQYWLTFTRPMHQMSKSHIKATALILYLYSEFRKQVATDDIAWQLTFSYQNKKIIQEKLDLKDQQQLQNLLSALRKKNIIINNRIAPSYIPNVKDNKFSLIFNFEIDG